MKLAVAEIIKNDRIAKDIFDMTLLCPEIAAMAVPGQFVNVYTGQPDMLLPRPISLCEINRQKGTIRLVYQSVGKGTRLFSGLKPKERLRLVGPLGNGFSISEDVKSHVLIGGGIGAPPLLELAKSLKGNVEVFLGTKNEPILADEFLSLGCKVHVATDDGSAGFKGNAVELLKNVKPNCGAVYACGPKGMLKAVCEYSKTIGIDAQISMEERMACGIGACVGCVIKIKKYGETEWHNLKVCKDGPVFLCSEVVWDE